MIILRIFPPCLFHLPLCNPQYHKFSGSALFLTNSYNFANLSLVILIKRILIKKNCVLQSYEDTEKKKKRKENENIEYFLF